MRLLILGLGYTGNRVADELSSHGAQIAGTVQSRSAATSLSRPGVSVRVFSPVNCDPEITTDLQSCDALLVSIPPDPQGDPALDAFSAAIASAQRLQWIGYLSTIGVYGDQGGRWIDERTPASPTSQRSINRLKAEQAWLDLGNATHKAAHVFRLAGIYGPGRNQLVQLAQGTARRIVKPGQVFNRIHVQDIARIVSASIRQPRAGAIYNVTDSEPAPPQDVVAFAAALLGREPPAEIAIADAKLTNMGRTFYEENKRVSNNLVRRELGVELLYPTYREGLTALARSGEGRS
jgi:nucleoside-diphosphate-sugar epimerase